MAMIKRELIEFLNELVELNSPRLSNAGIKNMLIRGTGKSNDRSYPNREWGDNGIIVSS